MAKKLKLQRKPAPRRLQLDLNHEAEERLETLRSLARCRTIPDLARMAFSMMDWYMERQREGYEVFLKRGDELVKADFIRPVI